MRADGIAVRIERAGAVRGGEGLLREADDDADAVAALRRDLDRPLPHARDRLLAERPVDRVQACDGGRREDERRDQRDEHGKAAQRP